MNNLDTYLNHIQQLKINSIKSILPKFKINNTNILLLSVSPLIKIWDTNDIAEDGGMGHAKRWLGRGRSCQTKGGENVKG